MQNEPPSTQCQSSRTASVRALCALVRADLAGVRAGFVALLISSGTGLVAGLTLGSITGTLEKLPGPHDPRARRGRHAGQRVRRARQPPRHRGAHRHLPLVVADRHARRPEPRVRGRAVDVARVPPRDRREGIRRRVRCRATRSRSPTSSSSRCSAASSRSSSCMVHHDRRRPRSACATSWDLDDVAAPVVTAAADSVTLPSLFLATALVEVHGRHAGARGPLRRVVPWSCLVAGWRTHLTVLRRIVRESVPVLVAGRRRSACSPASPSKAGSRRCSRSRRCSS